MAKQVRFPIVDGKKVCTKCREEKSVSEFYCKGDKLTARCKVCTCSAMKRYQKSPKAREAAKIRNRQYRRDHPEEMREYLKAKRHNNPEAYRAMRWRYKYGKDTPDIALLFAKQEGLCPICGEPLLWEDFHVDHSHETGEVRGLLHRDCNLLTGQIEKRRNLLPAVFRHLGWVKE